MTGIELAQETGLSYRQVDHWTTRGVLAPADDRTNPGHGRYRQFDEREARVGRALKALRELGAGLAVLTEVGWALRSLPDHEWHGMMHVNTLGMIHRQGYSAGWTVDLDTARG